MKIQFTADQKQRIQKKIAIAKAKESIANKDIAKILDISRSHVNNMLNGNKEMTLDFVISLKSFVFSNLKLCSDCEKAIKKYTDIEKSKCYKNSLDK